MSLPKAIHIHEEGPREGFQIEPGPIATADKVAFVEALAETGLEEIEVVSYVDARRVPGMADAEAVASAIRRKPGVRYTPLVLNMRGLERALAGPLDISGAIRVSASEPFSIRNANMTAARELAEQRRFAARYRDAGIAVEWGGVMTAFGCNFAGPVAPARVVEKVADILAVAAEFGFRLKGVKLADTVGAATPVAVERAVGAIRERWPDLDVGLHLHDTRGTGMANAYAGLRLGVTRFDTTCGGLGGCPFAGHKGAAGNICTEDLVFMCEEMGVATGIDLERLIECARMAERIVGHPLPGKVMRGGTLQALKARHAG